MFNSISNSHKNFIIAKSNTTGKRVFLPARMRVRSVLALRLNSGISVRRGCRTLPIV